MRFLLCTLGLVGLAGTASADGSEDQLGPREIAVGEAMRGGATGATAIGLNPAGLPLNRELVFEGGYGYRGSDEASIIGVSACDSTNAVPGCFFYDYIGSSPDLGGALEGMTGSRRTHVAGMAMSRLLVPRVFVGSTVKYFDFDSDMAGEESGSGFVFDLGATVRLTQMINLGLAGQNLYGTEKSTQFPRALGGGLHARPIPSLSMSFDMRWKLEGEDQAMRYGGGAELFLSGSRAQTGYPLRVGALHDNGLGSTYLSGGLGITSLKWGVDVAARREVKGGDELLVVASMRFWGPRMASPGLDGSAME
jgi:hypothetical protein